MSLVQILLIYFFYCNFFPSERESFFPSENVNLIWLCEPILIMSPLWKRYCNSINDNIWNVYFNIIMFLFICEMMKRLYWENSRYLVLQRFQRAAHMAWETLFQSNNKFCWLNIFIHMFTLKSICHKSIRASNHNRTSI